MMGINLKKDLLNALENESKDHKGKPEKSNGCKELMLQQKLNKMFFYMRNGRNRLETRTGLHASAIIGSDADFCYRQQVLSLLYEMDQGQELPLKSLQIFAAGESIHEKWQTMFEKCSEQIPGLRLIKNEARSYDSRYNLLFTPDTEAEIDGTEYVVEYKSMNTFSFQKTDPKNPHPSARKQIMLYMFLKGIPNGIIIMEDKNSQEFKISLVKFNYKEVLPYIERLNEIKLQYEELVSDGTPPKRICKNCDTKRANNCNMRTACFFKDKRRRVK